LQLEDWDAEYINNVNNWGKKDSTHNELRDQLTSAQRNIVGTDIKKHHKY
jgi:hypothetical protein